MKFPNDSDHFRDIAQQAIAPNWEVTWTYKSDLDGCMISDAECYANERYTTATINYGQNVDKHQIIHELLHLATARLDVSVYRIIGQLPKKRIRSNAHEMWADGLEPVIEILTRIMLPLVENECIRLNALNAQ